MKPAPFSYRDPRSVEEALQLLADHGEDAVILAGGQSLVPLMNFRLATPEVVVDINRVPGLDGLEVSGDGIRLGSLVRASAVERHGGVKSALPVLIRALSHVGHPQIRNRTTIGGSLAHADPASELPTAAAALDGTVVLASRRGERRVGWEDFFLGPYMTSGEPDEMVVEATLSVPEGLEADFVEVARRHGDFALVGAFVGIVRQDGVCAAARIALCGVAGAPVRIRDAEAALVGCGPEGHQLGQVESAVRDALDPSDDIHASGEYRRHVAGVLVRRTLERLWREGAG
jgi:carbon-monoxide dehydrogenase medium subunit